jgi:DNA repair exonuclease SbcCD ATPase subunit
VIADAAYDSNGAGKTALYEVPLLCPLRGYLRYGNKRDLTIREGEKRNSVSLEFDLLSPDGTSQALLISRPRPGAVKLSIDGADVTSSDANLTQKRITALIGDAEFFLRLTLLALHYHPSFLRLTDSEKKRFIDEFSGLDCFEEARDAVYYEVNKIGLEESRAEFEKTRLDERKTVLERHLEETKTSQPFSRKTSGKPCRSVTGNRGNEGQNRRINPARPSASPFPRFVSRSADKTAL